MLAEHETSRLTTGTGTGNSTDTSTGTSIGRREIVQHNRIEALSDVLRVSRDSHNWRILLTIGDRGTASRYAGRSQYEVCLGRCPVGGWWNKVTSRCLEENKNSS